MINVQKKLRIMGNRGANGIDGVVSTAAGTAKTGKHVTVLIGDLSFYNDMNGLHAIKKEQLSLTIVLINNEAGGFFSFLHHQKKIRSNGNRRANEIAGVVSTAASTAKTVKHVMLLNGDLSFYHDMNGLHAITKEQLSLTIVLINNEGAGIFSFLPQKENENY